MERLLQGYGRRRRWSGCVTLCNLRNWIRLDYAAHAACIYNFMSMSLLLGILFKHYMEFVVRKGIVKAVCIFIHIKLYNTKLYSIADIGNELDKTRLAE